MKFNIKNKETKSFKKRYSLGYKLPSLIYGSAALSLLRGYNIEYIYLYNFKKSLKKYFNFKKDKMKKVWLFLHRNYPLTKKSKNARMGKGKGAISRYCSRTLQNHNLFEFSGFSLKSLITLKKIFGMKVNIPLRLSNNFLCENDLILGAKSEGGIFLKKYKN
jgi:ribosomal protein L16/L10AE